MRWIADCRLPIAGIFLLSLSACAHGEPFEPESNAIDQPLIPGAFPVRLTFNRGQDRQPSWLPDGSGIVYTAEQFRYDEGDWCLVVLPRTGGRVRQQLCPTGLEHHDSVTALSGAVSPGGLLALYRASGLRAQMGDRASELVVTDWIESAVVPVVRVPFTLPGAARPLSGVSHVRWLDSSSFVFRGDLKAIRTFDFFPPESLSTGRHLVRVTLAGGAATVSIVPGTDYATSVAARGSDEIVFTRGGESIVYRHVLSTGATSVLWDFGGPIARGVQLSGNSLVALVGGNVSFVYDSLFADSALADFGGFLHFVDLAGNTAGLVDQFALYRHPALSPDGRLLVVENIARAPDLFLYFLP